MPEYRRLPSTDRLANAWQVVKTPTAPTGIPPRHPDEQRLMIYICLAVAILCVAAGCGTGTGGNASASPPATSKAGISPHHRTLPPRPADLPLTDIAPCALLAGPLVSELGVGPGTEYGTPQQGNAECVWSTASATDIWIARTLVNQSATTALGDPHSQIVEIAGFPAVQTSDPTADPSHTCELYVDVSSGQSLLVAYVNGASAASQVSTTHSIACQQASKAAEAMIQRLTTVHR